MSDLVLTVITCWFACGFAAFFLCAYSELVQHGETWAYKDAARAFIFCLLMGVGALLIAVALLVLSELNKE